MRILNDRCFKTITLRASSPLPQALLDISQFLLARRVNRRHIFLVLLVIFPSILIRVVIMAPLLISSMVVMVFLLRLSDLLVVDLAATHTE